MLRSSLDLLSPTDDDRNCKIIRCCIGLLCFYIGYRMGWGGGGRPNNADSGFALMHLGETHDVTKQHSSLGQAEQLDPQEKLSCV